MWFISLPTVLAHNNDLVRQVWQVTQIGLIYMGWQTFNDGLLTWQVTLIGSLGVNAYTLMFWSIKLNDRPENSHFMFPSFAPATRLCPPKAYIGMITRKLKSLLQMTLNALKVCNNRMEAGSMIHFLIYVSYPWPILSLMSMGFCCSHVLLIN